MNKCRSFVLVANIILVLYFDFIQHSHLFTVPLIWDRCYFFAVQVVLKIQEQQKSLLQLTKDMFY